MQEAVIQKLFAMRDENYKRFQCGLMPSVASDTVIGVRTPQLRRFAKTFETAPEAELFLQSLPHKYYEENNLHALIIEQTENFDDCIAQLDRFLPYVNNWASCDMLRPKCFKEHTDALLTRIKIWLASSHAFTVRFGIEMLMIHFLDDHFKEEYLDTVCGIQSGEYYVNTMKAWFFATALAKRYDSAVRFIEENKLPERVHNMTIQKAVESLRISSEKKKYLKKLKIKKTTSTSG